MAIYAIGAYYYEIASGASIKRNALKRAQYVQR